MELKLSSQSVVEKLKSLKYEDYYDLPIVQPKISDNAKHLENFGMEKIATIAEILHTFQVSDMYWRHCDYSASLMPPILGFGHHPICIDGDRNLIDLMKRYYKNVKIVAIYRLDFHMLCINNSPSDIKKITVDEFLCGRGKDNCVIVLKADDECFGVYTKVENDAVALVHEFSNKTRTDIDFVELFIDYCRRTVNDNVGTQNDSL